jgi:hypothetical protein
MTRGELVGIILTTKPMRSGKNFIVMYRMYRKEPRRDLVGFLRAV